jgi:hypothetical protein
MAGLAPKGAAMVNLSARTAKLRGMSRRVGQATDDQGTPLLTVAARRVGTRRAFKVLTFMASWEYARRQMRVQTLTVPEYAEWWREPEATAYRHQALFREAFPGEKNPDRLLDAAAAQWDERTGVAGLGRVTFA